MCSKGSRFTLHGGVGVELCSLDVAFMFATHCNRSKPSAWRPCGRAYSKLCKRGHIWMFPASRSFISRRRRGTSWHSTMFHDVSKKVLCDRRNTFATFSEDALHCSWQAQHFGDLRYHFAWQAQHFPHVALRIFGGSHCQGCAKWWQAANSVACVAFCDMWCKSTEASHETSILRYRSIRKLVGKRRFWSCEMWNLTKSHTKCSFWCSNMHRLESLASLVPS